MMFKKIKLSIVLLFVLLLSASVYAQVPQGFNFQAIARDSDGLPLVNQELSVRISILEGSETGEAKYVETHTLTTNSVGLIQLVIGQGSPVETTFDQVNWSGFDQYVKLEIDPAGGTEFEELGTSQLLAVPYAILAENVVNGGSTGDFPFNLNLNNADEDSAFVINLTGDGDGKPFQVFSKGTSYNGAVWGEAISEETNEGNQRGVLGFANGLGQGTQIGIFGGAVNFEATGGARTGVYGQAASQAKYNFGVRGIVQGNGSGEIVPIGDEVDQDYGSYNIGGGFYSSGNLNGNVGVEAQASGSNGERSDFGVIGRAIGTGNSQNVGVRGAAFNSPIQNIAFEGDATSEGSKNLGLRLFVDNGTSNIGMEVHADTAAILNGNVIINGSLIHNGGTVGGGESPNGILDSLFVQSQATPDRMTRFYPGYINNRDENGNYSIFSRTALQYGDESTEGVGSVYNWYSKGGMQVAHPDYANGERAAGLSPGYFFMDIYENESFYAPFEYGIGNASEGGRAWFMMNSLEREKADKAGAINLNIVNNADGNDPTGESGELFLNGNNTPNFQIGAQSWNNNDRAFFAMYGSTADGGGWFRSNLNMSIGSDETNEWADIAIVKTNISGESQVAETVLIDGNGGNITITGSYNQASDERLKKNIKTLDNALINTLSMRGVSYTWKEDSDNKDLQIGVIAQEVEEIYPEFVRTDDDGMKSVNYAQMTAVLIEAVKELNAKIEVLETENSSLRAQSEEIKEMKSQISKIMSMIDADDSETGKKFSEK